MEKGTGNSEGSVNHVIGMILDHFHSRILCRNYVAIGRYLGKVCTTIHKTLLINSLSMFFDKKPQGILVQNRAVFL
jgi:hypothetical protein